MAIARPADALSSAVNPQVFWAYPSQSGQLRLYLTAVPGAIILSSQFPISLLDEQPCRAVYALQLHRGYARRLF